MMFDNIESYESDLFTELAGVGTLASFLRRIAMVKRNAKGEGNFKCNPDGTVAHRKSVGYKTNGYRKILTVTAPTKSACIKLMKQREKEWRDKSESEGIASWMTVLGLC